MFVNALRTVVAVKNIMTSATINNGIRVCSQNIPCLWSLLAIVLVLTVTSRLQFQFMRSVFV